MEKILIISNRLPVQIKIANDKIEIIPSVGGLATGMKSVYKALKSKWIGWDGLTEEESTPEILKKIEGALDKENCIPVRLTQKQHDLYYYGFSNKTIWPLFHYFTQYAEYENDNWEAYKEVNRKFAHAALPLIDENTTVWIHDYQLMLLPELIREVHPNVTIGFFLHIPFPSYEVFRLLPWRKELLNGLLGADLIGFHTFDYERHFISCVRRLLGFDTNMNLVNLDNRIVKVDAFPMGIDYDRFHSAAVEQQQKSVKDKAQIRKDIEKYFLMSPDRKLILSIDRLDYSKGIANRLIAFELFLEKYPEFQDKVTLVLLAVPSRTDVAEYQFLKNEIDGLVGRINGRFASINWTPIWYFYRSMPFENLIELYNSSEIALITPLRDGMNLVAKEYIAAKTDGKGVLILSEMAGSSHELSEALIVNPNNIPEIADTIYKACKMPVAEQIERNTVLQKRLKRYNVEKWANDFMHSLQEVEKLQRQYLTKKITQEIKDELKGKYKGAKNRLLFLDYDGTLVGFKNNPKDASPDEKLIALLDKLANDKKNRVIIISGRDRTTFDEWFVNKNYTLITEHGVWFKEPKGDWTIVQQMNNEWKEIIRPNLEMFVDRTPGSFIEEKDYSLVWHYRKCDPELGILRALEIKDMLTSLTSTNNLEIMEGNKVLEIKNGGINKGRSAMRIVAQSKSDFIIGIGDDWTDEFLFEELPNNAVTIKVGLKSTKAKYKVETTKDVRDLLLFFSS